MAEDGPKALGVASIDKILKKYGTRMINRLHGPIPTSTLTNAATSEVSEELISTMRVRFDGNDDPEKVAKELKKGRWRHRCFCRVLPLLLGLPK